MKNKALISFASYCVVLTAGLFLGFQLKSDTIPEKNSIRPQASETAGQYLPKTEYRVAAKPEQTTPQQQQNNPVTPEIDLNSTNADVRLNSLFTIWKSGALGKYQQSIQSMSQAESDSRVKEFISWVSGVDNTTENFGENHPDYNVHSDPELLLQETLSAQTHEYAQDNEMLPDENWTQEQELHSLVESDHSAFIEDLIKSNEDASIETMASLISHQNREVQQAAIEGLITVLDDDTGHSQRILELLDTNAAYLDQNQMAAIEQAQQLYLSHTP